MVVYVDNIRIAADVPNGNHVISGTWSHLVADTHDELMAFAARLGLNPAWLQNPHQPLEHFDVTANVRARAVRLGALPLEWQEAAALTEAKLAGDPFDLYQHRLNTRPDDDVLF